MDASKNPKSMDQMTEMFFPSLIPGASVVIQQDFLHWKQPWIAAQMAMLAEYFSPVAFCRRNTIVFLCTRVPDEKTLHAVRTEQMTDSDMVSLIDLAATRFEGWELQPRFDALKQAIRRNPQVRVGWKMK